MHTIGAHFVPGLRRVLPHLHAVGTNFVRDRIPGKNSACTAVWRNRRASRVRGLIVTHPNDLSRFHAIEARSVPEGCPERCFCYSLARLMNLVQEGCLRHRKKYILPKKIARIDPHCAAAFQEGFYTACTHLHLQSCRCLVQLRFLDLQLDTCTKKKLQASFATASLHLHV